MFRPTAQGIDDMGREVRMIKPGWEHPRRPGNRADGTPRYRGLMAGPFSQALADWEQGREKWEAGLEEDWAPELDQEGNKRWKPLEHAHQAMTWEEWYGARPQAEDYMPEWEPGEATLLVMYENTSEGTPISPGFETPEELARWLADNRASAFGDMTASYEEWLVTCRAGWSVGAVIMPGAGMISGVAAWKVA